MPRGYAPRTKNSVCKKEHRPIKAIADALFYMPYYHYFTYLSSLLPFRPYTRPATLPEHVGAAFITDNRKPDVRFERNFVYFLFPASYIIKLEQSSAIAISLCILKMDGGAIM
jgi:hypothetical protein